MEEQFVPYGLAVKLKELGFDEECLTKWGCTSLRFYENYKPCSNKDDIVLSGDVVAAPLWQQAFDWLRKKHYLYVVIIPTITMDWTFKTTTVVDGEVEVPPYKNVDATDYSTYEEARQTCLEKLIQILEENI